jgi:hypothetical protein
VPFYDAAVAGYLAWGAAIGVGFMVTGLFVVGLSTGVGLAQLASDFVHMPEIARQLVVSPLTAKTHVSRAMTKLNARDRAQLVVMAYEHGLTAS